MLPLDELRVLDQQAERVVDLAGLKPLFSRVDEIARQHSSDFEVQLAANESKQKMVSRGTALKQLMAEAPVSPPTLPPSARILKMPDTPPPASAPVLISAPEPDEEEPGAPAMIEPVAVPAAFQPPPEAAGPRAARRSDDSGRTWKRALTLGVIAGVLVAVGVVAFLVNQSRKRNLVALVDVQVQTTPPGAQVRVNGEAKCTATCRVALKPGEYQFTAFLDGYEPAASTVKVALRQVAQVNLQLQPQTQMVRILTDLPQGQVILDDQPPAELQDGQFIINKVPPGAHTVKLVSRTAEGSFRVEVVEARAPAVTGPVVAKNLFAMLVSSMGAKARVVTNAPLPLKVNGQAQGEANAAGVEVNGFQPGVVEFVLGEGTLQRSMTESFGPAPALTVFLKSDQNIGTLVISAGEDGARVFLNGKEYPRRTLKGQLRIQTIGSVNVRVAKDGFELAAPQIAEVKKGSEVRLEFKLQSTPQVAVLQIRGATPGAEVVIDQKVLGTVADDGSFTANAVQPGDKTIELRREQYVPKRVVRSFQAGQTVALAAPDVVLALAVGTVRVTRTPLDAVVTYRRVEETQAREWRGNQADLPPGNYVFSGRAAGFNEKTERVSVIAGDMHTVELALTRVAVAAAPPPPPPRGIVDFEDPNAWSKQGDLWVHKGGGFIPFKPAANGTFTFTVRLLRGGSLFRGGRIRWAMQYVDARNHDLFEMDRKNLFSKVIIAGKTYERGKFEHGLSDKEMSYTVQLEVSPEKLVTRLQNGENWLVLDTWQEPGRNFTEGKFGFLMQGGDEIGLSDFKFVAR